MPDRPDLRIEQERIIREMVQSIDLQLVVPMGGGKTVCTLTAFDDLVRRGDAERMIVFAPPRVARNVWPAEADKWHHLDELIVQAGSGSPAARKLALSAFDGGVLCFSLDVAKSVCELLKTASDDWMAGTILCIDELSRLKSPRSTHAKALAKQAPRFGGRWGLTGTLRPNGYEDQYMPLRVISGGSAWDGESFDMWRRRYFRPLDYHGYNWEIHTFAKPEIDCRINAFTHAPPAVDLGLAGLNEGPEHDIEVELSSEAHEAYGEMLEHLLVELGLSEDDDPDDIVAAFDAAAQSAKLEQIAQGFLYRDGIMATRYPNPKLDAVEALLAGELANERVVICHHYREDAEQLRGRLGKEYVELSDDADLDRWARGEIRWLGLHPRSAGHGIDTMPGGGRRMLWYNPPWSPELYDQTIHRLYRPGQTEPVFSHQIIARDTVDEVKRLRVRHKREAQDTLVAMLRGGLSR